MILQKEKRPARGDRWVGCLAGQIWTSGVRVKEVRVRCQGPRNLSFQKRKRSKNGGVRTDERKYEEKPVDAKHRSCAEAYPESNTLVGTSGCRAQQSRANSAIGLKSYPIYLFI